MQVSVPFKLAAVGWLCLSIFLSGCGLLSQPAPKPDVGPAGKPVEAKPNPPVMERFVSPPVALYDLEAVAGVIFEGINKQDWSQVQSGMSNLQSLWQQGKAAVGEKKGVKEADDAIGKLTEAVNARKVTDAYENLNKFMGSIGDIGQSYKLSPLSDIIAVSNGVRNVSFYVEDKDWKKAASKAKELQGTWEKLKPSMEQVGILGEITKTHSIVSQIKDAVDAENQGAIQEHLANINESMGRIRQFFRGR